MESDTMKPDQVTGASAGEPVRQGTGRTAQHRIQSLDALRGIAALSVVLYHYTFGFTVLVHPHVPRLPFSFRYGHLGVNLFFIVSGLVILRTLERCRGVADFMVSRIARLYPAFLAATCIALVVLFGFGYNLEHVRSGDVIVSLTMLSDLAHRPPVDPSFWTLGFEVTFYVLAGIGYLLLGVRRIEVACLLWLATGVVGLSESVHHNRIAAVTEGAWSYLFVLGMMIHLIYQRRATVLTLVTIAACLAMCFYVPLSRPTYLVGWQTACVTGALGLSVWGAVEGRLRFLNVWPLLFLGDISYSLYLVHQVSGMAFLDWLEHVHVPSTIALPATLIAAIAVASVMRYAIEIPGQRMIKDFGRRTLRLREHASHPSPLADTSV